MDVDTQLLTQLELLIKQLSSDLSAIALIQHDNRIRWHLISGNMNERYRRMVMKPGNGLVGQVFRYGRVVIIDSLHVRKEQAHDQYAIMISEQLVAAIGVPLHNNQRIYGVLIIGDRHDRSYTSDDVELLQQVKERIIALMPKEYVHFVR